MTKRPPILMTMLRQAAGRLQAPWQRLRATELGQGLVEYALIIAVVSIGSIVSLTFMKDSISGIFNKAGNSLSAVSVGAGPPPAAPQVAAGPQPMTTATAAEFEFTGATGVTFECKLDSGAFDVCTSPQAYPGPLATGDHTFKVQAKNPGGTSSPATFEWTVGVVPAAPEISSGPNPNTTATSAAFAFTAAAGATVECKLDGAAFDDCDSSTAQAYTGLATGAHTFQVRATNAFGTGPAATRGWTIGTPPAAPSISSGPNANTTSTSASFVFSAAGGATLECKLDGAAFTNCATSTTQGYSGLGTGGHTFQVRATNAFGTSSAASHNWTIGTVPAQPNITSTPSANTTSTSASFVFSAAGGTTVQCKLDGAAFSNCATSTTQGYSGLATGGHTFQVQATNAFGTSSAASYAWTIGTVPAEPTITSGPNSTTTSTSASFVFSAAAGTTRECKLDGAAFTNCATSTTQSYSGLAVGGHTFQVRASNAFGTSSADSHSWTITAPDTTAPNVNITSPSGNSVSTSANISGTCGTASGDAATITLTVTRTSGNGSPSVFVNAVSVTCSGGNWSYNPPSNMDGNRNYSAVATQSDTSGNVGTDTQTFHTS